MLWFAAQLNKDGWIAFPVSTAGYSDILLTFDFRVVNMTSSANYVFEFSPDNGETWTYQIFSYGDLNVIAWDQLAFDLKDHPEFNDKPDFIFRVRSIPNLNGDYERFDLSPSTVGTTLQFDRVALSGTPLPPAESTPQESWRETHFGTTANEGDAADTADPEGDGLPNLLEYALGLDPLQSDSAGAVSIGKTGDGQRLALTFTRIADPALTYTVEATDDLVSGEWTPVFTSTDTENTAGSYTAEDADLISAHARRFLRLVVSTEEGDVRSTPRGYVKYDLLSESDTFVALPVERSLVFQGKISSVLGNTIILDGDPDFIPASLRYSEGVQENTYYLQILSGTAAGYYSTVIDNGADDITAEFSPDIISRIQPGDAIAIRPYWTLGTLLPSADAGQSFIASTNNLSSGRRTEILFPDLLSQGINKSVESTYFFNSYWRKVGDISPDRGDAAIPPDGYIIISGTNYAQDTSLLVLGEVPTGPRVIPLVTVSGQQNDNLAGLNVPVDLTLDQLNLVGSDRPFTVSTNNLQSGRGDELTVFDNSQRAKNKSGSDTYFYNGYWRKVGSVTEDQGSLKLPAGSAIVIRKKAGVATAIDDWLLDTTPLWQQHE
ncbi:hypothetical protein OPIT5_20175 [Opitutaceae bacterium TAV5]|nr:hypothetical protein OPIT5_20175 [Opitutaceae bacterium TAV5]